MSKKKTSISLDDKLINALDQLAGMREVTRSDVISGILYEDPEVKRIIRADLFRQMDVSQIAEMCHQFWRTHCRIKGLPVEKDWSELNKKEKQTALWGVKHVLENLDITPAGLYLAWRERKKDQGWKPGKVKDKRKKSHPLILDDFENLPDYEKDNYIIFLSIVRTLTGVNNQTPSK